MSDTEETAKRVAKEVVDELFLRLGVNVTDNEGIIQVQKDFTYLRESREGKEELIKKGKLTLIGTFVTGVLAVILNGIIHWGKQ